MENNNEISDIFEGLRPNQNRSGGSNEAANNDDRFDQSQYNNASSNDIVSTFNNISTAIHNMVRDDLYSLSHFNTSSISLFDYRNLTYKKDITAPFSPIDITSKEIIGKLLEINPKKYPFSLYHSSRDNNIDYISIKRDVEMIINLAKKYAVHYENFLNFFTKLFGNSFDVVYGVFFTEHLEEINNNLETGLFYTHVLYNGRISNFISTSKEDIISNDEKKKLIDLFFRNLNENVSGFSSESEFVPYKFFLRIHINGKMKGRNKISIGSLLYTFPSTNKYYDNAIASTLDPLLEIKDYSIDETIQKYFNFDDSNIQNFNLLNLLNRSVPLQGNNFNILDKRITFCYIISRFSKNRRRNDNKLALILLDLEKVYTGKYFNITSPRLKYQNVNEIFMELTVQNKEIDDQNELIDVKGVLNISNNKRFVHLSAESIVSNSIMSISNAIDSNRSHVINSVNIPISLNNDSGNLEINFGTNLRYINDDNPLFEDLGIQHYGNNLQDSDLNLFEIYDDNYNPFNRSRSVYSFSNIVNQVNNAQEDAIDVLNELNPSISEKKIKSVYKSTFSKFLEEIIPGIRFDSKEFLPNINIFDEVLRSELNKDLADLKKKYANEEDKFKEKKNTLISRKRLSDEVLERQRIQNIILEKEKRELTRREMMGAKRIRGGNYIQLPPYLKSKLRICVLNIESDDLSCFKYCINAWTFLCWGEDDDIKKYEKIRVKTECKNWLNQNEKYKELDWNVFNFENGVEMEEIKIFADSNKLKIVIFGLDHYDNEASIKLMHCFGSEIDFIENKRDNIYLLFYRRHFMLIKNVDNFFQYYMGYSDINSDRILCQYCDNFMFSTSSALKKHIEKECGSVKSKLSYELPSRKEIYYENKGRDLKVKTVVLCDFEAFFSNPDRDNTKNTVFINRHVPFLLRCVAISDDDKIINEIEIERDINENFMKYIDQHCDRLKIQRNTYYNQFNKIVGVSSYDLKCNECKQSIFKAEYYNCDDTYYHSKCIDDFMNKTFSLVVLFHNFKNYDLHFIADEVFKKSNIFVIPKSKEKYTTIQYEYNGTMVRFGDSRSFLSGSLDSLSKKLTRYRYIGQDDNYNLKDLIGKQSFPYEYIDSYDKLLELNLPSEPYNWYSSLSGENTSEETINRSIDIFIKFECKNILEYAKLYLKMDVLLLAEIISDFRETAIYTYGVDPLHYFTLPGYAWDMALKTSNVKLELLNDRDLIELVIKGVRGGISSICEYKRLQADDKNSILYIDANNLYGWAMSQKMPFGNIKSIKDIDFDVWVGKILSYDCESDKGYLLEVDIEYPHYLHEEHNALPFLAERINEKLCLSLKNKKNYFVHIRNLKQAMENGLLLVKIHKIMEFSQSYWLKEYIDKNTNLRKEATTESSKDFYKLMNNAVFGKSMENVFKRCKYTPVSTLDFNSQSTIRSSRFFESEELYTENIMMFKTNSIPEFNKPMYVGFCILELSKWKMYDTFYNGIKKKWPQVKLAYMDTDSFVISIPKRYDEIDFIGVEDYFDLSVYNGDWKNNENKGVLGKMKDEFPWGNSNKKKEGPVIDFIALRSKSYALMLANGEVVIKCKGVGSKKITFNDFISQYEWPSIVKMEQVNFKSLKHEIYTTKTNKIVFNNIPDDKRLSRDGDNKTLAIGYNK